MCLLRYNNEAGKGNYNHVGEREVPYHFTDLAMLHANFWTNQEIARRLDRDVKAVHGDVQALVAAGVLDRADSGHVAFPYDAVHVDFTLREAA